jgi:DNA modification methylase
MEVLLEECINFFTKSIWADGSPSNSLVIGFEHLESSKLKPRIINQNKLKKLEDLHALLMDTHNNKKYDFIIINLRGLIHSQSQLKRYIAENGNLIFSNLRNLLTNDRYGCFIIDYNNDEKYIPFPWTFSYSLQNHLKLRDEKIGIIEDLNKLYYCIFFQSVIDDYLDQTFVEDGKICVSKRSGDLRPWIIPKNPPRNKDEIYHPAKFPESLIREFIKYFTRPGQNVFDPMVGTGSTLVAAAQTGRNAIGIELNPEYVRLANKRIESVNPSITLIENEQKVITRVFQGDALRLEELEKFGELKFDYCVTSPPYWSILHNKGSEYQRSRRDRKLQQTYSEDKADLSNIENYLDFLSALVKVYSDISRYLTTGSYLTIIVKNLKRNHTVYPLAWDLVRKLCHEKGNYEFGGNTFWLQDDIPIKPFAVGIHWVSNTVHQYCLHIRRK